MRKKDELTDPRSCLNRAKPDEMLFVLLGRDRAAAETIRFWVARRIELGKNNPSDPQICEALAAADAIEAELPVAPPPEKVAGKFSYGPSGGA